MLLVFKEIIHFWISEIVAYYPYPLFPYKLCSLCFKEKTAE